MKGIRCCIILVRVPMRRIFIRINDSRSSLQSPGRLAVLAGVLLVACCLWQGVGPRAVEKSEAGKQIEFGVKMALKGAWREAAFRFDKAVKADGDNAMAHNDLAVALENLGRFDEARESYEKAVALDPENEKIRSNYDRFMTFYRQHAREDG